MQYYRDGTEQLVQKLVSSFVVGVEIAVSEKKTSPYDVYASEQAHIFWFPVRAMEEEGVLDLRERIEFYKKTVHFLANEGTASAGRLNCCRSEEPGKESSSI